MFSIVINKSRVIECSNELEMKHDYETLKTFEEHRFLEVFDKDKNLIKQYYKYTEK